MVQKRPYDEEEVFRISYKHPRQVEHSKELGSELLPHSLEVECEEKPSCEAGSPGCFQFPIFRQCFSPERPMNEIYNLLMANHAPPPPLRKIVPIGPDHQADIPPFGGASSRSETDDDHRRMGKCVISTPETDPRVGIGRADCDCAERDSLGCVRKHVKEAREGLLRSVGPEAFEELGFRDMGEEIALRWTEGEEREFQRLVFSNPASSGKNFWDKLSDAFPYLTRPEIVSYYFNVFILRKRASQNRCDPTNADSDNDDWQGIDDGDDDDDDDESVVAKSPIVSDETIDSNSNHNKVYDYPYRFGGQVDEKEMIRNENRQMESENGNHCLSSGIGGYILEHCYAKDWDSTAFVTCSKSKVDFLPTCNVIEEVFGEEI